MHCFRKVQAAIPRQPTQSTANHPSTLGLILPPSAKCPVSLPKDAPATPHGARAGMECIHPAPAQERNELSGSSAGSTHIGYEGDLLGQSGIVVGPILRNCVSLCNSAKGTGGEWDMKRFCQCCARVTTLFWSWAPHHIPHRTHACFPHRPRGQAGRPT